MKLLEAPLEALVFRYSAAAAGSLWALIAVLAAALGLWRIRAVGFKSDARPPPDPPSNAASAPAKNPSHRRPPSAARPLDCHVEGWSSPKGRFTAYFDADEWSSEEEVGTGGGGEFAGSPPWERWGCEGLGIRMRGDLGWYRYQDLSVLNGSVVKLWESDGWLTAESQRGPRRRI